VKKLTKILLAVAGIVLGGFMLFEAWLASMGVITVNYDRLTAVLTSEGTWLLNALGSVASSATILLQSIPIAGGLAAGFLVGLKTGLTYDEI
jgi:uncharacterized membrane protein (Fun14 family)